MIPTRHGAQPAGWPRWVAYAGVFLVTAVCRYITLDFPNDHYVYISGGWQMLAGDWPTRDWVDPGLPLMFLASAVAQALFGPTLLGEALLVSVSFGAAAAITVAAVVELNGSVAFGLLAAVLEVLAYPRTYGYPKMLVYAAAFWAMARYVRRPTGMRAVGIALSVVIGFLFRHDHGLFLGVGGALTILLVPVATVTRLRHLGGYTAAGLASVAPYLLFVQANGGLSAYLRAGLEFSRREAERQWHVWPAVFGDPDPLFSAFVYVYYALPLVAVGILLGTHGAERRRLTAQLVPLAVVAVMVNYNFVRDPLVTRLPDAIVPAAMLVAWMLGCAWHAREARVVKVAAAAALAVFVAACVFVSGDIVGNLDRVDALTEWRNLPRMVSRQTRALEDRGRNMPTPSAVALRPFFAYLTRCTTLEHRLVVGGFMTELPFFAQRLFAGGQPYFGGSFGGGSGEPQVLARLSRQTVPFALLPSDYDSTFERDFMGVAEYLQRRFSALTVVEVREDLRIRVLVDRSVPARSIDEQTGWPCYRP